METGSRCISARLSDLSGMAQSPEFAAKLCAVGDVVLKCQCKNPYRAILQAAAQGLDSEKIQLAYQRRHEGATLRQEDEQLLQAFEELVNESAGRIGAIRAESDQRMRKINVNDVAEFAWSSPKGKFTGAGKGLSEALGRDSRSTDLNERHPFDVELLRIAPGKTPYPYHSHTAQWEFYHVLEGEGVVRHKNGMTRIAAGDAFIFQPEQPHQITNDGSADLIITVVADNPVGESCYYPDSNKTSARAPGRKLLSAQTSLSYYDGEE
jgi:uncharacterized cupin superfamily protein